MASVGGIEAARAHTTNVDVEREQSSTAQSKKGSNRRTGGAASRELLVDHRRGFCRSHSTPRMLSFKMFGFWGVQVAPRQPDEPGEQGMGMVKNSSGPKGQHMLPFSGARALELAML